MNTLPFPRFLRPLLGLALALIVSRSVVFAAEPTLVVAQGTISGVSAQGAPVRATLRNLANEIMRRYPTVTINIVGVEDVVVGDLTLRWPASSPDQQQDAAVNAVLAALLEATENRAFSVSHPSHGQFLLTRPRAWDQPRSARNIDVFNLKLYLQGPGDKTALETELRHSQLHLNALREDYDRIRRSVSTGNAHPNEETPIKNGIAEVENRLQLVVQKLKRATPTKEEKAKRIEQLIAVVRSTLAKLDPGEKMPEFEYHDGTHLLIVIGSDAAIDVTRKVVTALEKSSD